MSDTRIINSDETYKDVESWLFDQYQEHKYLVVSVKYGRDRTLEQNRLQRKWMTEAESQGDMTAEEYRGYCKLHFGVPIMRESSEDFRGTYDRLIRPMDYEDKLKLMMVPMDLPVTRIMGRKEKSKYLDKVYEHFTGLGFRLTVPNKDNQ